MARAPRITEERRTEAFGGEEEPGANSTRRLLSSSGDDDDYYDEDSDSESGDDGGVEAWCLASAAVRAEHSHVRKYKEYLDLHYGMHATFYRHFRLAVVVGLFIAVAALPVYSINAHYEVFGLRGELANLTEWVQKTMSTYDNKTNQTITWDELELRTQTWEKGCGPMMIGPMRNVAAYGDEPEIIHWNKTTMTPWNRTNPRDLWCGWLPDRYSLLWPNVVQFIVFTVYRNTGSTIRAAWQGLSGTIMAASNMAMISRILHADWREQYPEGLLQAWSLLVIFLFLFSRTDVNTKKWGMSWHIWFMLNFLNPATGQDYFKFRQVCGIFCDDDTGVVVVTTMFGALISILATLVPPVLTLKKTQTDVSVVTKAIDEIWTDALKYFLGHEDTRALLRVQKRIEELEARQIQVRANIEASWWECFGLFGTRKVISMRKDCFSALTDVHHIMYGLSRDLRNARHHAEHDAFVMEMGKELQLLQAAATELMKCCVDACMDGIIDEDERANMLTGIRSVSEAQKNLTRKYRERSTPDLSEPNVFAFFLSYWARRISDYAKKILNTSKRQRRRTRSWFGSEARALCENVAKGCGKLRVDLFDKSNDYEHTKWATRNFIPIAITFCMAANIENPFLTKYDTTMPNTLALLIFPSARAETEKDAHRFLAVALGRLLPVMMLSMWESLDCSGWPRLLAQFWGIFIFVTTFVYIYYASLQWSYLGCLIAGFGVYPLLTFCKRVMPESFSERYAELGQVSLALTIQICVCSLPKIRRRPDQKLVGYITSLDKELRDGYEAYFEGNLTQAMKHEKGMQRLLTASMAMAPQCDPKLEIAPFWHAPFKFGLANAVLKELQVIVGAFAMLKIAMGGLKIEDDQSEASDEGSRVSDSDSEDSSGSWSRASDYRACDPKELLRLFGRHGLKFQHVREDFMHLLGAVMGALPQVLEHRSETPVGDLTMLQKLSDEEELLPIERPSPELLRSLLLELQSDQKDDDVGDLTGELCARAAVVVKAIADAYHRLHRIKEALLKEDIS